MKKQDAIRDFYCSGIGYIVSIWIFIFSFNMTSYTDNLFKPAFIPRVIAGLLAVFSTIHLVDTLRVWKVVKDEPVQGKEKLPFLKRWAPLLTFLLLFLYLFSMSSLGFTISTMLYLYLQMLLLSPQINRKTLIISAVVAIIAALVVFFGFVYGFHLSLPLNRWRF